MNKGNTLQNKIGMIAIIILIIIIILPLGYSLASYVLVNKADDIQPLLEMPDLKYKDCVEDTEYMR